MLATMATIAVTELTTPSLREGGRRDGGDGDDVDDDDDDDDDYDGDDGMSLTITAAVSAITRNIFTEFS